MSGKAQWYVVHTYSGYENKVAANLEKIIENRKLEDMIFDIRVPTETVVEKTEKGVKEYERKVFPSYILVKMIMTNDTWFIVRNTRGVTGFVGATTEPIPLSEEEVKKLGVEQIVYSDEFTKGDSIKIIDGGFNGCVGVVEEVYKDTSRLKVVVSMFGRETPVEVAFDQVTPVVD